MKFSKRVKWAIVALLALTALLEVVQIGLMMSAPTVTPAGPIPTAPASALVIDCIIIIIIIIIILLLIPVDAE